jgi:hypothetical protein
MSDGPSSTSCSTKGLARLGNADHQRDETKRRISPDNIKAMFATPLGRDYIRDGAYDPIGPLSPLFDILPCLNSRCRTSEQMRSVPHREGQGGPINQHSLLNWIHSRSCEIASKGCDRSLASRQRRADPGWPGSAAPASAIHPDGTARTAETGLSRQPVERSALAAQQGRDTPESRDCTTKRRTETRTAAPRTSASGSQKI